MRTRETLSVPVGTAWENPGAKFRTLPGTNDPQSSLWVPLLVGGEATGVISLQNLERTYAFDSSDIRLLETLASSMSVALENARFFGETQRRASETAALNEIGREISATLDLTQVLEQIATHAEKVLHARDVVVRLASGRRSAANRCGARQVRARFQRQCDSNGPGHYGQRGAHRASPKW